MFSLETGPGYTQLLASHVDLKDAYYTVPIYKPHRKFLKFIWASELYKFTCMPNGLACCPPYFHANHKTSVFPYGK